MALRTRVLGRVSSMRSASNSCEPYLNGSAVKELIEFSK